MPIPEDASAIVVRQYIADRAPGADGGVRHRHLDPAGAPPLPTDTSVAESMTAMGWTVAKLLTLHRTVLPGALDRPNELSTVAADALGGENTTPDNLYVLGTWRLGPDEALEVSLHPAGQPLLERDGGEHLARVPRPAPAPELGDQRRRPGATGRHGAVVVPAAAPPPSAADGTTVWLDTGGRHRGFLCLRWLDNPEPPDVRTAVLPLGEA